MKHWIKCAALLAACLASTSDATTPRGPAKGTLIIVGGGKIGPDILGKFIELAGGPDAPIVVIPTAGGAKDYPQDWPGLAVLKDAGARNITVLHTLSRKEANSTAFVAPLLKARAVFFPGGRQWRLVDSYAGTRVEREVKAVLARGGVVGGTSAGASIQASYLVRGAREGNKILMAPGYEKGFGLVDHVAVDQHNNTRGRVNDMATIIAKHPDLLGIGLDESTAIVVKGSGFDVLGSGHVHITVADKTGQPQRQPDLQAGQHLDFQKLAYAGR
jgi:cyanophycinase